MLALALIPALLFSFSAAVEPSHLELGQTYLSPLVACPVARTFPQPSGVDSALRATYPPPCPQSGTFEPYNGRYTVLAVSPPDATLNCFVGHATLLFDNNPQSEWNAYSGNATTIGSVGGVTSTVTFSTGEAISPAVFSFKPQGSPNNGFTNSFLEGRASVVDAWQRVGTFTLPSDASSDEYGFRVSTGGKFFSLWRWTITPTDTLTIREAHFYVEPSPIRATPSASRYPHNYQNFASNDNTAFDNNFATFRADGQVSTVDNPLIVDFYYESVMSDSVVGLFWSTTGALANGITKSKLVAFERDGQYGLWGDGNTLQTSAFAPIPNWKSIPSYGFSFFALGNDIQLSEVNFVLCPKFSCPCYLNSGSSQGPLICTSSAAFCAAISDPVNPIPLRP